LNLATTSQAVPRPSRALTGRNGLLDKYFYFAMSLLMVALVVSGFGQTVNSNLFHPDIPRPTILWVHAATFSVWVLFFVLQSALVRSRNVRIHRTLGWFGAALGAFMFPLGLATAVAMTRFKFQQLHEAGSQFFVSVPFNDMLCFAIFFALAVYWRKKPEFHRRSIFIATSVLMAAAFGRFPYAISQTGFYLGVDALILLGIARDLLVNRRIHTLYRVALPLLIVLQSCATYLAFKAPAWWARFASAVAS